MKEWSIMMQNKSIDPMKHDEKLTISVKEAAEMMGIGLNNMYELVHSNGFPVVTIGRKKFIIKSKFVEWLEMSIGTKF